MKWVFWVASIVITSIYAGESDTQVIVRNDTQFLRNFDARYTCELRHAAVAHYLGPRETVHVPLSYKNTKDVKFALTTLTLMQSRYERHHVDLLPTYLMFIKKAALFFMITTDKVTDELVIVPALTSYGQKIFEKISLTSQQWIEGLGIKHQKPATQIKKHQDAVKKEIRQALPTLPEPLSNIMSEYEGPEIEYEFLTIKKGRK